MALPIERREIDGTLPMNGGSAESREDLHVERVLSLAAMSELVSEGAAMSPQNTARERVPK